MPTYKDKKTNTWRAEFCYKDVSGNTHRKCKRGFRTKKEAIKYIEEFKRKNEGSISMLFKDFVDIYLNDRKHLVNEITTYQRKSKIINHFLPVLGEKLLNEITPLHIKELQINLVNKGLSPSNINRLKGFLSGIFNHAIRYYGLKENPCHKVENLKVTDKKEMKIWTNEEFNNFLNYVEEVPFRVAFETLYYTGMRIGELTALTIKDIDFSVPKIIINKSYQVYGGKEFIFPPKTEKSNREVIIPITVANHIKNYLNTFYEIGEEDRIFFYNKSSYGNKLRKICDKHHIERIRIHDFRHSHASLLIESGFNPVVIANRLGHEDIKETLNTYSHLYPNKQEEVANYLETLI